MATKRMFDTKTICSDRFILMTKAAQALYVQLCIQADDDGVVSGAKVICRMGGFKAGALKELYENKYLLKVDGDLCVISHWLVHNKIRKDRYRPSVFWRYLENIYIDENGMYVDRQNHDNLVTLTDKIASRRAVSGENDDRNTTDVQPDCGIGKVRLGKERGGEVRKDKGMRGREAARPAGHASREYPPAQNILFFKNTDENQSDTKAIGGGKPLITPADLQRPADTVLRGKIDHNEYP